MSAPKLESIVNLLAPVIETEGVNLYDLEFVKEGSDRILRLYIDKESGVDLEDCERVSRAAEEVLDAHDPIPTAYFLEVSSPGVERKLSKPEHYTRYIGHKIALKLYGPQDGRKKFTGELTRYENNTLTLTEEDGTQHRFQQSQIGGCKLVVFD
ncbi:MAG: ribosome maturation factor RimP [Defluviitaleaceae bacterium]|nr:ribosome maturation factor RimP [Defluviitaleaceae bacterium]